MKRMICVLVICLMLSSACIAEQSSTDRFLSGLSDTWGAFLDMAQDAGNGVSRWAEESGVTGWIEGAVGDVTAWADDNGLTDWAKGALNDVQTWFDDTGITDWANGTSREIQAFIDENRPAVEAWLAQAGQDVRAAWDTLVEPDGHTEEEIEAAYEVVVDSLEDAAD